KVLWNVMTQRKRFSAADPTHDVLLLCEDGRFRLASQGVDMFATVSPFLEWFATRPKGALAAVVALGPLGELGHPVAFAWVDILSGTKAGASKVIDLAAYRARALPIDAREDGRAVRRF